MAQIILIWRGDCGQIIFEKAMRREDPNQDENEWAQNLFEYFSPRFG